MSRTRDDDFTRNVRHRGEIVTVDGIIAAANTITRYFRRYFSNFQKQLYKYAVEVLDNSYNLKILEYDIFTGYRPVINEVRTLENRNELDYWDEVAEVRQNEIGDGNPNWALDNNWIEQGGGLDELIRWSGIN